MPQFAEPISAALRKKNAPPAAAGPQSRLLGTAQRALEGQMFQPQRTESTAAEAAREAPNWSTLPEPLKAGVEQLSGLAMDDVRVHRNSVEPGRLGALAYTQGRDIYLGRGQERHLPHEAWHVVQQMQGRVQATMQMKGATVNNDVELEAEADRMAMAAMAGTSGSEALVRSRLIGPARIIQRQTAEHVTVPSSEQKITQPSRACIEIIQRWETCAKLREDGRYDAYPDPLTHSDPWTIGWGSTGADIKKGVVWTRQQCDDRFAAQLAQFAAGVAAAIGDAPTTQNQFDAMVSVAYTTGISGFKKTDLLKKHKAGEWAEATKEFGKLVRGKAGGKSPGLERRRAAEAALYKGLM